MVPVFLGEMLQEILEVFGAGLRTVLVVETEAVFAVLWILLVVEDIKNYNDFIIIVIQTKLLHAVLEIRCN